MYTCIDEMNMYRKYESAVRPIQYTYVKMIVHAWYVCLFLSWIYEGSCHENSDGFLRVGLHILWFAEVVSG